MFLKLMFYETLFHDSLIHTFQEKIFHVQINMEMKD